MRLFVASDSHGRRHRVNAFLREIYKNGADAIVFLGDILADAQQMRDESDCTVYAVAGNCDFGSSEAKEIILNVPNGKLLLCHGDRYGVKQTLDLLAAHCSERGVRCALYGHTHIPSVRLVNGVLLINPGALKDGKYAIVDTDERGDAIPRLLTLAD